MRVDLLTCGWTTHPGAVARRGGGLRSVRFPALVAAVHHPTGVILYDTGYAPRVQRAVGRGVDRVYGGLLPVHVTPQETALAQLAALGVAAVDVTTIVLSHLHADHLGGLHDFPAARIVLDPAAVTAMRTARGLDRLSRGWLPALLPEDVTDRVLDPADLPRADVDLRPVTAHARVLTPEADVAVVPLPGHSDEHLGLLVRTGGTDLLLLGDAVWHTRAVTHGELPHPVVSLITRDWAGYRRTVADLARLHRARPDLVLVPSHDTDAIAAARARLEGDPATIDPGDHP
ncbi:MBL fold metallo-hydrolase [Litorihabitans aurantiacus]|uniref:MBL fold metallo-hydrolase n=1 Tax=Litorihabitans aurantiacus TaxID=1930061 RepID=A0AA37XE31_9MICO|nr:MBL fold metallo-hydrolase [Litorihabitans aurantiacus]GMA31438.1 MBL fold metallo-hydrolase [Litorihabitans aurantiacus]